MANRSLIKQLGQIDGSHSYDDSLLNSLAESTGRDYQSGTIAISSGSSTVTDSSNNFEEWENGHKIVIASGAAAGVYTVVSGSGGTTATVTPTPTATDAAASYDRHYYQNLEDDLNYIRSMLDLIIGGSNWYDTPPTDLTTLSGHQHTESDITDLDKYTQAEVDALISGGNEFLELTDVEIASYNAGRVLYTTASGVIDDANMTYDSVSGTLSVTNLAATSGATVEGQQVATREDTPTDTRVPYWNEAETRFDTEGDTYFAIDQSDDDITIGANSVEALSITSSGIALEFGARIDEFSTDGTLGDNSDVAVPTEQAVKTYVDAAVTAGAELYDEFLELEDVDVTAYAAGRILFESADAVIDDADLTYDTATDTLGVSNIDATGNLTVTGTVDVAGAVTFEDDLTVNGTFGFDEGTTVNEFSTDTTLSGNSNDAVPTEAAVKTYVDTAITAGNELYDEFIELTDTPAAYAANANKLVRVNGTPDALVFEDDLVYDGSTLTVSGDFDLTGSAVIETNISVSGTLDFGGQTVDEIVTEISSPTDSQLVTAAAVEDYLSGSEGQLVWEVVDTPYDRIQPRQEYMGLPTYTPGDLTVGGDLTVTGSLFYSDVETLQVSDNIIDINYGEAGAGVTAGIAGLEIDRGTQANYLLVFDEPTDTFRVGVSGTLQAVATREDSPVDTVVPWWNDTEKRFDTSGSAYMKVDTANDDIELAVASTVEVTVDTNGLSLKTGASINEFSTDGTLADDSDDAVPTEKAVKLYVDTVAAAQNEFTELTDTPGSFSTGDYLISTASGLEWTSTIDHNTDTSSKDGGTTGEYYHLTSDEYSQFSAASSTAFTFGAGTALDIAGTFALATGTTVNEIVASTGSLSAASTDDQLATAKLIYDEIQEITTGSGSITHNLLDGLQGGNGSDEFYHLTNADYLTVGHSHPYMPDSFTESDPVFTGSPAYGITASGIANWNTAYGWGDHGVEGYLTSADITDVVVDGDFTSDGIMLTDGSGTYSIMTSSSGINEAVTTVVSGSTDFQIPTAKAVWDLTEAAAAAVHIHYDVDAVYSTDTSWTYGSGFTAVPDDLQIFVNGVKQRIGQDYDCTVAVPGAVFTITFLYEVDSDNWVNITYTATE